MPCGNRSGESEHAPQLDRALDRECIATCSREARNFSGGRRGYSLYFSVVCPGRSHNRRTGIVWELVADTADAFRFSHHETIKAEREALYAEFVDEATRLYGDALGHQKDDAADLIKVMP